MSDAPGREWLAFHFFHHEDHDLLLREGLLPLAAEARAAGLASRFFFVRYSLGGPHVRLRLEPAPDRDPRELEALIAARAEAFFARHPSATPRAAEEIAKLNQRILAADPNETDDRVLPDNFWERAAYRPELARYGGAALLDLSHELFLASSLAAGELLVETAGLADGQVFPRKMVLLGRLAAALAEDDEELGRLLGYGVRWWPGLEPLAAKAAERFAASPATYLGLWRRALSPPGESAALRQLLAEARSLRGRLAAAQEADPDLRFEYLLESHLHMTANRLGLENANEVFALSLLAEAHRHAGPSG